MYLEARSKPSKFIYKGRDTTFQELGNKTWIQNDIVCAHTKCPECGGSGVKASGVACVHALSCRCKSCSPGVC